MHLGNYDHRGNGRSGRPPSETITFERLCADALREHLGFEEVAVLGYSFQTSPYERYIFLYPRWCETPYGKYKSACLRVMSRESLRGE
jgi:pimeloyl-ACP methyl ester carboxylesterase